MRETGEVVYRSESRRVLATMIRLLRDFDLAEEALHEAFAAAIAPITSRRMRHARTCAGGLAWLRRHGPPMPKRSS